MLVPVLLIAAAFLSGSIPFGYLIAKAKGVDIRREGSGNIGATNVGRILGRRYFYLCFALDTLKGLLPTLGAGVALGTLGRLAIPPETALVWLAAMVAAVLGHVFSPWLGFKGGKGISTSLGAMLGVFPAFTIPALGIFVVWGLSLAAWRYISLSSILAGLSLPLMVVGLFVLGPRWVPGVEAVPFGHAVPFLGVAIVLAGIALWTHRGNIARLRKGTEPRVGKRVTVPNAV